MGVIETVRKCVNDNDIKISEGAKAIYHAVCSMSEEEFVNEFSQCALHGDGVCILFGLQVFPCTGRPILLD